jgi:tetratricopeptide (TPR) repeat protein
MIRSRIAASAAAFLLVAASLSFAGGYDELNRLAVQSIREGNEDAAVELCNRAISIDPNYPGAYITRSWAFMRLGALDKALADCTIALDLRPNQSDKVTTLCNRASVYELKRNYAKAIEDCIAALSTVPNNPLASNNLAWLLATSPDEKMRDGAKAFEYANKAYQADPTDGSKLGTLAAAYAECGDFEKAVEWQQKAIKTVSNDANTGNAAFLKKGNERLKLYESRKPYRLPAAD